MGKAKKVDLNEPVPILEEEDEATLAAIDRGIKAADEGRVVPLQEVRQRMRIYKILFTQDALDDLEDILDISALTMKPPPKRLALHCSNILSFSGTFLGSVRQFLDV